MLGIVASVMSLDIVLINLSDTTTLTTPPHQVQYHLAAKDPYN